MKQVFASFAAFAASAAWWIGCGSAGTVSTKTVEVRIGWQPGAGAGAIIDATMKDDQALTRQAAKLGYQVTESWTEFQAGPPLNEAVAAGQIDIDLQKTAIPVASAILAGVPAVPIAVTLSPLNNGLMVALNGPIRDVSDLPGRTVGLPIGTSGHYLLASIVYSHFRKSPEEIGIKLVNLPTAEAVKLPRGIDAAVVAPPLRYIGPARGLSECLVDGYGNTGRAHRTPGVRLPEVHTSWAYPEGYNLDRAYVTVHEPFLRKHPDLVRAFLLARMETMESFLAAPRRGIELINRRWQQPGSIIRQTLEQYAEFGGIRAAPYITESDALALIKASEFLAFMKLRDRSLTWEELKSLLAKGAEIQRSVWQTHKSRPSAVEMERGFSGRTESYGEIVVKGGAPVWEWSKMGDWGQRTYIPGPFQVH